MYNITLYYSVNYNNGTHQRHVPGRLVPDTDRSRSITHLPGYRIGFGIMGEAISGDLRSTLRYFFVSRCNKLDGTDEIKKQFSPVMI